MLADYMQWHRQQSDERAQIREERRRVFQCNAQRLIIQRRHPDLRKVR